MEQLDMDLSQHPKRRGFQVSRIIRLLDVIYQVGVLA